MLFSIVTVTFNAQHTLQRTLQSIGNQSFRQFQLVIVDGASTDGTITMAEKFRDDNQDIDIKIICEPDKGIYDAMNKGIANSKGTYLCFLNSGDKFHSDDVLQKVADIIDRQEIQPAVVYGETDIVDDNDNFIRHRRLKAPERLKSTAFKSGMLVCHQSFYARKDIVPTYNIDYRFSADFDWCINVMAKAELHDLPMVNTNIILTDYLQEGMTTQNHKASLRERFRIMAKHYGLSTTILNHIWFVIRAFTKK